MKIAHVADIHIRGLSRHPEFKQVFEAFAEDVKKNSVDHIFVGGDIFHTKTSGISPEYIDFLTWWLKTLAEAAPVHLTLGNHDGNLVNASRQDAISPIVAAIKDPRITLYKQSGVYEFSTGFNWCIFSLFDEEGWKDVKPVAGMINIACFHGPVKGAYTESDWMIEEGLSVDFFKDYEFTMLGDIHRTQFLDFREVELIVDESELSKYPGAIIVREINE